MCAKGKGHTRVLNESITREALDLFARAVDDERVRQGLTVRQLAARARLKQPDVHNFLRKGIRLRGGALTLQRLAAALGGKVRIQLVLPAQKEETPAFPPGFPRV